jgi:pimeloyl-ACP methyl ester carboxylesterase
MEETYQNELPYELSGNYNSNTLIVFLHGFPDSMALWDKISLKHEADNLCLKISYPNYNRKLNTRWGWTFESIIKGIKDVIDKVKKEQNLKNDVKVFIVSHDWGASITYMFDKAYPGVIHDGVVMEIGFDPDKTLKAKVFSFIYQVYFAIIFLLPRFLGDCLAKPVITLIKKDYVAAEEDLINCSMCYFYFQRFKLGLAQSLVMVLLFIFLRPDYLFYIILLLVLAYKYYTWESSGPLYQYKPSFPFAFIYGTKKLFMFHSDEMLEYLNQKEKCEVIPVDTGHWVMFKNEDFIISVITRRLKDI